MVGKIAIETLSSAEWRIETRGWLPGLSWEQVSLYPKPRSMPVYQRAKGLVQIERAVNKTVFNGPSPPGVFLGSADYPFLRAGPLVPILPSIDGIGDAAILDDPSRWLDTSIDDLVTYRFSLVR